MPRINKCLAMGLSAVFCLSACSQPNTQGDGKISDHDTPLANVQSVKIDGHYRLLIHQDQTANLRVHVDENLQSLFTAKAKGHELVIGTEAPIKPSIIPELTLTLPTLTKLEIRGENVVDINQLKTQQFNLLLSGRQRLHLSGKALDFEINASGNNTVEAKNFSAKNVKITANGHNNLVIACDQGNLTIKANGANQIIYGGSPTHIQQTIQGNTSVTNF